MSTGLGGTDEESGGGRSRPDAGTEISPLTEAALLHGVSEGERLRLWRLFEERRDPRGNASRFASR